MSADTRSADEPDASEVLETLLVEVAEHRVSPHQATERIARFVVELMAAKERERVDLVAALILACEGYQPCEECDTPAAELWHWNGSYDRHPPHNEVDDLTAYCRKCAEAAGVLEECTPAEPADQIAAIGKVRHILPRPERDTDG